MPLRSLSQPWEVRFVEDGTLVKVTHHDLDVGSAILLFDALLELAIESGQPHLFLDFGSVEYMTSAVLGRLIVLDRKLRDAGGSMSIFSLRPQVAELLEISHLTTLLDVRGIPLPRRVEAGEPAH